MFDMFCSRRVRTFRALYTPWIHTLLLKDCCQLVRELQAIYFLSVPPEQLIDAVKLHNIRVYESFAKAHKSLKTLPCIRCWGEGLGM